ncbi:hypothetical protein ANN_19697 [Periplaneta americana]|uniref:Per a allergen n=1 Tax=Periplaneta americana TaxID=6978 RepID=A0ABQ8SAX3_PERAM|nr:hypothetical protein ANN_19697 [Periplaneta americana]
MAGLCEGSNETLGSLKAIYTELKFGASLVGSSPLSGSQHSLKCAKGTRCRPVCTVVQQGEIESIPASSYRVHHGALRFLRVRDASPSVLCADDP